MREGPPGPNLLGRLTAELTAVSEDPVAPAEPRSSLLTLACAELGEDVLVCKIAWVPPGVVGWGCKGLNPRSTELGLDGLELLLNSSCR